MRKYKRQYKRKYAICILILSLVVTQAGIIKIRNVNSKPKEQQQTLQYEIQANNKIIPSRSSNLLYIENEKTKTVNIYSQRPIYQLNLDVQYQDLIWNLCLKNNLSYEFVLAVFYCESKFKINAVNIRNSDGSQDQGIAQLNSYYTNTFKEYAIQYCNLPSEAKFYPFNADHNIRAGIGILVYLRDFWRQRGMSEDYSIDYIAGSFHKGITGFQKYIRQTGKIESEYSKEIKKKKEILEKSNTF